MHDLRCLAWQTVPLDVRRRNSRCHLRTRSGRRCAMSILSNLLFHHAKPRLIGFQSLLKLSTVPISISFLVNSDLLAERPLGRVFQTMVEEFAAQLDIRTIPVDAGFIQEMRAVEQWIDCLTITERLESVDFLLEHGRDPETYFFTCLLHVDGDQRRVEVAAQFLIAQQLAHARILAANHVYLIKHSCTPPRK
ncbi:hypothetical protein B0H14DRAFT_2982195 [Mycena olivaceomarginata]|nr:hypothetical protein B0H14DRAFT_2982195 [Mycena olivaceomarginata]